jgi:hypothetical protein
VVELRSTTARIGAVFYVIWGVLHLNAARTIFTLGQPLNPGMVQARLYQDAWNILFGAITVIAVGTTMNWRNSRTGFWINLVLVVLLDLAFVIYILVPGYAPLWPGLEGPVAGLIAVAFSTVGLIGPRQQPTDQKRQKATH